MAGRQRVARLSVASVAARCATVSVCRLACLWAMPLPVRTCTALPRVCVLNGLDASCFAGHEDTNGRWHARTEYEKRFLGCPCAWEDVKAVLPKGICSQACMLLLVQVYQY